MPILRVTKEQVEKAREAREAALRNDRELQESEKEQERLRSEAIKEQDAQKGAA